MHRSISMSAVLSVAVGIIAVLAGNAFPATFSNSAAIAIPAPGSSNGTQISVSGLGNSITDLTVGVSEFSSSHVGDVGLVVVGPTGSALVLMGDCSGTNSVTNISLAFSDSAASALPNSLNMTSGTFKPTQYASIGSFPSPGPDLSYHSPAPFGTSTLASIFQGSNPNGNWSLFVIDPTSGDSGSISNGWTLQITATGATPEPAGLLAVMVAGISIARRQRR